MNKEERRLKGKEFIQNVDWDTYDYTQAPGANMDFPDYVGREIEDLDIWISKHYNDTPRWKTCHVRDLNEVHLGAERRLWALYGVPVEFPDSDDDTYEEIIEKLEDSIDSDRSEFEQLLGQYGLVNEEHFRWMRARLLGLPDVIDDYDLAVDALKRIDAAREQGVDAYREMLEEFDIKDDVHLVHIRGIVDYSRRQANAQTQAILDETQDMLQKEFEANKEKLSDDLAPYKGVSMEMWAGANAKLAQGQTIDAIIAEMGIEMPLWDDVNAEWNARMSRDTTATIATVYGQAFMGGGQGQFGAAGMGTAEAMNTNRGTDPTAAAGGQDPISFEDWVKITEHMNAASAQGIDSGQVLSQYNLNAADWGTVGGYWAQKFNANAMEYIEEFSRLSDKYREQFSSGSDNSVQF